VHQKNSVVFRRLYRENPEKALHGLHECLKAVLVQFKREPSTERCIRYVVRLATYGVEKDEVPLDDEFSMGLCEWLLKMSSSRDKAVRYRVCQLVESLMNALSDDAEITDTLWDSLLSSMLERLRDKVPLVRVHAIAALERLQDPGDKEDPVCQEMVRMLQSDASNLVRRAVVTHLGISKYTLKHVLARSRDVKEDVRSHVYTSLGGKLEMRVLSITQRLRLLTDGLNDRSPRVRAACLEMMKGWLDQSHGDVYALLKSLDVENMDSAFESVVGKALWDLPSANMPKVELKADMTTEEVFYMHARLSMLRETHGANSQKFENEAPSVFEMCQVVSESSPTDYNQQKLLMTVLLLDLTEEGGRRKLLTLVRGMTNSIETSKETLTAAVKVFAAMEKGHNLSALVVECVNDVIDPLDEDLDTEQLQEELLELRRTKAGLLAEEKYAELAEADSRLKVLEQLEKVREHRWTQALAITCELLQHVSKLDVALQGLLEMLLLPGIQQSNPVTRMAAVKALCMLCMLDREEAQKRVPILLVLLETDQDPIKLVALKGLLDLAMLFDLEASPELADDEVSAAQSRDSFLSQLVCFLDNANDDLQTATVEGVAKLLFMNKLGGVMMQEMLTKMLLLHFNPAAHELERLQQCLAAFFPLYAYACLPHQISLARILVPTLHIVLKAPRSSPLAKAQPLKLAQFVTLICDGRSSNVPGNNGLECPHVIIAQAMGESSEVDAKTVSKILLALHVDPAENQQGVAALRTVAEEVLEVLNDKTLEKKMTQFVEMLRAAEVAPVTDEAGSQAPMDSPGSSCSGSIAMSDQPGSTDSATEKRQARKLNNKVQKVLLSAHSDDESGEDLPVNEEKDSKEEHEIEQDSKEEEEEDAMSEEEAEEEAAPEVKEEDAAMSEEEAEEEAAPEVKEEEPAQVQKDDSEESEEEPDSPQPQKEMVTEKEIAKFKVVELRAMLKEREADQKGLKAVLVTRLCELMNSE